nr:hypothetical protein [Tanacetum cinerariifolium]
MLKDQSSKKGVNLTDLEGNDTSEFGYVKQVVDENKNIHGTSDESRKGPKQSFADMFRKPNAPKAARLTAMTSESVEGANVAIPLAVVEEVSQRFENTLYGYFIGKGLAFPLVENYVKHAWAKLGLERFMLTNWFFFFQFATREGMEQVLENGSWLIRLVPIFLNIWTPNSVLKKDTITSAPIWVKLHHVPIVAFSKIRLSLITLYTSTMCQKSWGRNTYARALVEVLSLTALKDSHVVAIPFPNRKGHSLETVEVEYEWQPHVKRKHGKSKQDGNAKQVPGVCLTKPKPKLVYREVQKPSNTDIGESSTSNTNYGITNVNQPILHSDDGVNIISLKNSFESLMENDKDDLEDALDDDGDEVEEVYVEEHPRKEKQVKGASTPLDQVFKQLQWTSNGLVCAKGSCVILGWNPNNVNVVVISFDAQVIHVCVYFKADKKDLFCSFIYAHNRYVQRRDLWNNLVTHKSYVRNRPWCLLGDFNVSLSASEKSTGSSYIDTGIRYFQDCVEAIEMSDVNSTGLRFTWNQKPKGDDGILKKIDCVMANLEFYTSFVGSSALFQPYRISDHTPAVLRIPMESNSKPLVKRLKKLKKPLRKLLYDHGNLHENVRKIRLELDVVQTALDSDPSNIELQEEEATYLQAFNEAGLLEEKFLMQKAKVERLKLGDANTTYFHKVVPMAFIDHYSTFLGQQGVTSYLNSIDLFCNQLDNNIANHMIRNVSDQEIHDAIFSMGENKALGPDGYIADFFKEAWDIIDMDVIKAIKEFFTNGVLLKELNHTILALILKVTTPMKINDYRLISCCNILYKCISRIISNRMKDSLTELVSLNQSMFAPGRRISDNILLTQELMHNYHLDRGTPRCAFKVDIQKAYDIVDWKFLHDVLIGFGFHPRFIGWIMECVTSTLFFLSINGSLHGYFKGKQGLRQGDPMSPYLFTLVMKVLTLMLHRNARVTVSFTYHRYCSKLNLINLCFADDLFLFAHGDVDSARVIMDTLEEFKEASRLTPSLPKNTAYFCNVLNYTKLDILNILPFEEGKLPVKYLGVPLVPSRLLYKDCKELMENVKGRISDWKNKSFSFAGRMQLIQSVLASMHVYWASVFILLTGLMGRMSWGWRKILHVCNMVRPFIWFRVGDGSKATAWFDKWCYVGPLADIISNSDIYGARYSRSAKVKDIIVNDFWGWPNDWMLKYLELGTIGVPHLSNASDMLVRTNLSNENVSFSVAAVWECIRPRSVEVWEHLKRFTGIPNRPSEVDAIVDFLSPLAKMRSIRSKKRSPDQVIDVIKSTVRLKLLSCRFKKTSKVQMLSHLWELLTSRMNG